MAGKTRETDNVDLTWCQQLQDDVGLSGSQLAKCNQARDLHAADSGHTNNNKKETHTNTNKKCNKAHDPHAANSGPLIVGLTSHTTAESVPQ